MHYSSVLLAARDLQPVYKDSTDSSTTAAVVDLVLIVLELYKNSSY